MVYRVVDSGGFIAAMCHAVGAFSVVAGAVTGPVCFFHKSFERRRIAFVHKQVTRSLPTEHVARRVTPGCATVTLVAGEEIQKQGGVIELPPAFLAKPENISEELFACITAHEKVLTRSMLIAEPRGNGHSLDPECVDIIEKTCDFFGGLA